MPKDVDQTRGRIVEAAADLFYGECIRSVDAVAERAGVTKGTLCYHFASKDDLIAAYLDARDQPDLKLFVRWFEASEGDLAAKIEGLFVRLARSARHPKGKGCGFLRTAAELAAMPGHPAVRIGVRHKVGVETWLAGVFADGNVEGADDLARQVVILMDGPFATMLVHRDAAYSESAGRAAAGLVAWRSTSRSASMSEPARAAPSALAVPAPRGSVQVGSSETRIAKARVSPGATDVMPGFSVTSPSKSDGLA